VLSPEFPDEQPPLSDNAPPTRTTAIRHDFERDAIGRLVSKRTEDGTTDYRYDAADNLLSITFTDNQGKKQQLDYTYDANGQLLSETNSAGLLQYRYDELGNLQKLVLPDQRELNHLYYGSGHLHQINLNGRVISDFERDAVHDEVLHTQCKADSPYCTSKLAQDRGASKVAMANISENAMLLKNLHNHLLAVIAWKIR
jgi:YD repeat-containing protein